MHSKINNTTQQYNWIKWQRKINPAAQTYESKKKKDQQVSS